MKLEIKKGDTYGWLKVIKEVAPVGSQKSRCFLWECVCGTRKEIRLADVRKGYTKSCGCYTKWKSAEMRTKHGGCRTKLYRVWSSIKDRCDNPNCKSYSNYGGRGISLCERWRDFETFRDDMGAKPFKRATIERIDNDGDYCPENCRWASYAEQGANKRNNVILTHNGESHTLTEWARKRSLNRSTLWRRLKDGWTVEQALDYPVNVGVRDIRVSVRGEVLTLTQVSRKYNVSKHLISDRLARGWAIEDALRISAKGRHRKMHASK